MIKELYNKMHRPRDKRKASASLTRKSALLLGVGAGVHWRDKFRKSTEKKKSLKALNSNLMSIK